MSGSAQRARRAAQVAGAGRASAREARTPVCVRVLVDASCPRWLALAARDALVPDRGGARVLVEGADRPVAAEGPDAALVLAGEGRGALAARAWARSGVPTALLAPGSAPGAEGVEAIAVSAPGELAAPLGAWLAAATDRPLAMASAFPVCRAAVCAARVRSCAARNAALAALAPAHGADLPIMCASQASLALETAAAGNLGLGAARVAEVAAVCALGTLWRACARALARRSGLPVRATGALVAAAGTLATGAALAAGRAAAASLARGGERTGAPAGAGRARDDGYVTIGEAR